jgi:hypothetical protein
VKRREVPVSSDHLQDDPIYKRASIAYVRISIESWKLMRDRIFESPKDASTAMEIL